MKCIPIVMAFLVGFGALVSARTARAQRRYHIARPTFSPYHQFFRTDPGPLGQYHSFVRPRIELQRTLTQQAAQIHRQQVRLRTLSDEVVRLGETGAIRPTGTGSVFMQYSHYYSGLRGGSASRSGGRAFSRPTSRGSASVAIGGY